MTQSDLIEKIQKELDGVTFNTGGWVTGYPMRHTGASLRHLALLNAALARLRELEEVGDKEWITGNWIDCENKHPLVKFKCRSIGEAERITDALSIAAEQDGKASVSGELIEEAAAELDRAQRVVFAAAHPYKSPHVEPWCELRDKLRAALGRATEKGESV